MPKVKLTITDSRCRGGYFKKGQEYIVEDLCPPLCHELWNSIYPLVYALQNGAELDYGNVRTKMFDAKCPDECRVRIHGEVIEEYRSRHAISQNHNISKRQVMLFKERNRKGRTGSIR